MWISILFIYIVMSSLREVIFRGGIQILIYSYQIINDYFFLYTGRIIGLRFSEGVRYSFFRVLFFAVFIFENKKFKKK